MKKFLFLIDAQTTPPVIVEALDNFFTTGKDAALYRAYDVWSEERLDAWEEIVDSKPTPQTPYFNWGIRCIRYSSEV